MDIYKKNIMNVDNEKTTEQGNGVSPGHAEFLVHPTETNFTLTYFYSLVNT